MKSLLVVLAAVGAARGAVTCDECRAGAQDFVAHLLSQEGITEQTDEMKSKVCPQLGLEGCEETLDQWYPAMAGCIFNHFVLEADLCVGAGLCSTRGNLRDWTCEECKTLNTALADYMLEEETITAGVNFLQGDCFCGQEGHTEQCPSLVQAIVPLAFPVLAEFLAESTVEHCQEIVGVC